MLEDTMKNMCVASLPTKIKQYKLVNIASSNEDYLEKYAAPSRDFRKH